MTNAVNGKTTVKVDWTNPPKAFLITVGFFNKTTRHKLNKFILNYIQ